MYSSPAKPALGKKKGKVAAGKQEIGDTSVSMKVQFPSPAF
jgi:hypothetical protein